MRKYTNKLSNWVYFTKEMFSLLLWRLFEKNQRHHRGQQDLGVNRWTDRCWQHQCSKCDCWHTLCLSPRRYISFTFRSVNNKWSV
jgi:hypothetical protein